MRTLPPSSLVRTLLVVGSLGVTLLAPPPATAQSGGWQVHLGPTARHSFGRVIPNGDNEGFLSGAQIPAANDRGWASASTTPALRWGGPGGTPCRAQANYTYFQTTVTPGPNEGFEVAFTGVDDALRVTVNDQNVPGGVLGLRENRTVNLSPALRPGVANRVVITLADVCGAGNGVSAQLRSVPGGGGPAEAPTMVIDGTTVKTGHVQVTLQWTNPATASVDLDLYVADPRGQEVNYTLGVGEENKINSGGFLDVDAHRGCMNTDSKVENIVWNSDPPSGDYKIRVKHHGCGNEALRVPYTVTLRRDGQVVRTWTGTSRYDQFSETYTFTE